MSPKSFTERIAEGYLTEYEKIPFREFEPFQGESLRVRFYAIGRKGKQNLFMYYGADYSRNDGFTWLAWPGRFPIYADLKKTAKMIGEILKSA